MAAFLGPLGPALDELTGASEKLEGFVSGRVEARTARKEEEAEAAAEEAKEAKEEGAEPEILVEGVEGVSEGIDELSKKIDIIPKAYSETDNLIEDLKTIFGKASESMSNIETEIKDKTRDEDLKEGFAKISDTFEGISAQIASGKPEEAVVSEIHKTTEVLTSLESNFREADMDENFDTMIDQLVELEWVLERGQWDQKVASERLKDEVVSGLDNVEEVSKKISEGVEDLEGIGKEGGGLSTLMAARLAGLGSIFTKGLKGVTTVLRFGLGKMTGLLGGVAKLAGPVGAVAAAGAVGYGIGTIINKGLTKAFGGKTLGEKIFEWSHPEEIDVREDIEKTKAVKTEKEASERIEILQQQLTEAKETGWVETSAEKERIKYLESQLFLAEKKAAAVKREKVKPRIEEISAAENLIVKVPEPKVAPSTATEMVTYRETRTEEKIVKEEKEIARRRERAERPARIQSSIGGRMRESPEDSFDVGVSVISAGLLG